VSEPEGIPDSRGAGGRRAAERESARWRAEAYLEALEVPAAARPGLVAAAIAEAREAGDAGRPPIARTLAALRRHLVVELPATGSPAFSSDAFERWRVARWLREGDRAGKGARPGRRPSGALASTPRLVRRSMVPEAHPPAAATHRRLWGRVALRRRMALGLLVLAAGAIAGIVMLQALPVGGPLEVALAVLLAALFGWISVGFWTALAGFSVLLRRRARFAVASSSAAPEDPEFEPGCRIAIVMPICDEPVEHVFASLRAMHASLERTRFLGHFDFFVLSDSIEPGTWAREEEAWARWCHEARAFDRVFYRHRRCRVGRKAGNIADFCRRFGARYRYMVVLDADSLITGEALIELVRIMERNPGAALVQSAPRSVQRRSLFGRLQQFDASLYGPLFAAGLHFWQLGDGQYWGHNAILRVAPFMRHCALPSLPGRPPLGGEILSHDFVESALLGRAGYAQWLAFDLAGSFEEPPSSLLEEMQRDRRWCQGNLQHLRLIFARGLYGAHRALFLRGAFSYLSALLWLAFLAASSAAAVQRALREPDYFPAARSLFPVWPEWRADWALLLLFATGTMLFLPKLLGLTLVWLKRRNQRAYGGTIRLVASATIELLASSLLAPVRMAFHSRFVVLNLLGREVSWRSPRREDQQTGWREALRHHGLDSALACLWGASVYSLNPDYFWWLLPIVAGLALSVPLSVLASRVSVGVRAKAAGLLLTPEETAPPVELVERARRAEEARRAASALPAPEQDGFVRAVVDPYLNALHCALLGSARRLAPSIRATRRAIVEKALRHGPSRLSASEKGVLLADPDAMRQLHERVWELSHTGRASLWGRPGRSSPC
jgi:membrane glycosyltransferase